MDGECFLLYPQGIKWRRERDSNPRCLSASLVFKTSAFNRSAISPCCGTSEGYYNSFLPERQSSFCKKSKKLGFAGFDWLPAVVCLLQWAETQTGAAQNAALLETSTIESARLHGSSCAGGNSPRRIKSFFTHISHHPPRAAAGGLALFNQKPRVRVSFGRLPDCRSRNQFVPKWEKHSKNHSFFGISFWRQAGRRKVFPEIE